MARAALAAIASRDSKLISRDRVLPLALWLVERYGGPKAAYRAAGLPRQTFNNIIYGWGRTRFHRDTARKLVDAVLAHRIPDASRSLWDTPRRLMPDEEREAELRQIEREERQRYRKKGAAA